MNNVISLRIYGKAALRGKIRRITESKSLSGTESEADIQTRWFSTAKRVAALRVETPSLL